MQIIILFIAVFVALPFLAIGAMRRNKIRKEGGMSKTELSTSSQGKSLARSIVATFFFVFIGFWLAEIISKISKGFAMGMGYSIFGLIPVLFIGAYIIDRLIDRSIFWRSRSEIWRALVLLLIELFVLLILVGIGALM